MDNYRKKVAFGALALAGCAPLGRYDVVFRDEDGVYHHCTPSSQSAVKDEVFLRHGYLKTDKARDYYTKRITAKDIQLMKSQAENASAQTKVASLENALSTAENKAAQPALADFRPADIIVVLSAMFLGVGLYTLRRRILRKHLKK